jgi:hypothetical protein
MTDDAAPAIAPTAATQPAALMAWRFNRHELAGAFGDLGTDLPLIAAMIVVAKLDAASVLIVFGALQVLTGWVYRMPMPVQPLKAMAALVITQQLGAGVLYGGGLAIGVLVLLLTVSGSLTWLARVIPTPAVRGIQFGLGLQLALLAGRDFIAREGAAGWALAAGAFALVIVLWGNRRWPAALAVVGLGALYAGLFKLDWSALGAGVGFALPVWHAPAWSDVLTGLIVLALPQLPLSLANSLLATHRLAADLFPERAPSMRKLGLTYSLMNLIAPLLGGVPVCHGSGGMAGHHAFGARGGVSVMIYGGMFLVAGLLFSGSFDTLIHIFPKAVLGVLLFFEGLALLRRVSGAGLDASGWLVTLITSLCAAGLPNGYLIGLALGWLTHAWLKRHPLSENPPHS